ncbi:MAG: amidase [Acidimicrobiales bacterium]
MRPLPDEDDDLVDVLPPMGRAGAGLLRHLPWVVALVVLGAIFLGSAYARTDDGEGPAPTIATAHIGECLDLEAGPSTSIVPCDGPHELEIVTRTARPRTAPPAPRPGGWRATDGSTACRRAEGAVASPAMDFRRIDLEDLADQVRQRTISSRELTELALARIDATNPAVNALVAVDGERALAEADDIDRRVAAGEDLGPLAGIPIGVKDTEDAIGFRTTQGSALFADRPSATADSILVDRLREAGCVIVGKTNTPELAWKADTDNRIFGRTGNPWSLDRSAGGSSGGSSAAVAAGMVPLATGSDGGGSLRIPASLCGLTTLKASLGRVPAGGPTPPGWADLSSKGVLCQSARSTAYALDAVIGPDPTDLRALPMPDESWRDAVEDVHAPLRVLWSPTLGYAVLDDEVRAACEAAVRRLEDQGTEVIVVDDVFDEDPAVPWLQLSLLANLRAVQQADPDGARWSELDEPSPRCSPGCATPPR